jgi:hypothetical protein
MKSLTTNVVLVLVGCLAWVGHPQAQNLTVELPDVSAKAETSIDIPVTVKNFDNIGAVTLVITYDSSVLAFDGLASAARSSFNANSPSPGEVRVTWFDATGSTPLNIEGSPLLVFSFQYEGGSTDLTFNENLSEIANIEATPVEARYRNGSVVPSEQTRVSSDSSTVDASGSVDFGDTGIDIAFSGVTGSGPVKVEKFGDGPTTRDGITEPNVSTYRFVVESGGDLVFDANTAIRLDLSTVSGVEDPSDIVVYRRGTSGRGPFTALSTTFDESANELVATTDTFSEFVLASATSPLPVELASFEAARSGQKVLLAWQTASETNNAGFAVEHRPPEASAYVDRGFVEGQGTTSAPQSYRFTVSDVGAGTHSFRLRQVDTDGTTTRTDPVTVTVRADRVLALETVGPNPVRTSTRVAFTTAASGPVDVSLFNVLGQRVQMLYDQEAEAGQRYAVEVSPDGLASGTYFVRLSAPQGTRTETLTLVK